MWFEEIFEEYKRVGYKPTPLPLFNGSIIFVVGKSPIDIMEPILL